MPPARSWLNYERALDHSAEEPFLVPGSIAARRRAFRDLVERCYKDNPDHPVIRAQHRRLVEPGGAGDRSKPSRP